MRKKSAAKSVLAIVICTSSILGIGAGTAFGGEITGNGQRKQPLNGNSICQFSGQNDEFHEEEGDWPRVQSFGQEVRGFASLGLVNEFAHANGGVGIPGTECNGNLNPLKP